jgi:amino acid transporter
MAQKTLEQDKKVLHSMGYAQQLSRRMSLFSNFAISFSIICILAGGRSAFPAAFNSAGPGGTFMIWLLGGAVAMTVAFGMGQIGSSFPTAGGLYHWSSHLGGKFWGWATAWFNLVGLICVVSSVDVLLYAVFFKGILLDTVLHSPLLDTLNSWVLTITPTFTIDMWQLVIVAAVLASQALLNHYGIGLTTRITDLSGYLIIVITAVLIVALFAFAPVALDFSRLVTFTNFTGDAGGGVVPTATPSIAFAFLLGLSYVLYTLTGYDASAHTSEETHDAQVNVPRGMWTAVFWSWSIGLIMVAAFILAMPSVEEGAAAGWSSFNYMYGASRMPFALSLAIAVGLVLVNYACALAGMTSGSRMMFAFARDGGLPASQTLSHVSTTYRTPTYAIWVVAGLALLSIIYAPYYLVLAIACAVFMYLSYVMPIAAGLMAEGKKWKEKGPFNLGRWSKPNAVVAIVGALVLAITGFFPPNEKVFQLTVAMVIIMPILWFALIRNRFQGVPEGERIKERQKLIADIEAKYAD